MIIKLPKKFADKHLDAIINSIYHNFKLIKNDKYIFDLTETEYIANQELLVLSSLFSLFVNNDIEFEVLLFKKGVSTNEIPLRVRKQIIELWVVWEIWRIIPNQEYYKYFNLDGNSIERLQKQDNYYPTEAELYGRYGVTPFIQLDFINNYDANEIQQRINGVFKLTDAVEEILEENDCYHPFTSKSLSTIISEELYLNYLDHSSHSAFESLNPFASLSISFKDKLRDDIVYQNKKNFETEQIPETKPFFYDSIKNEFHNMGYVEFSFLDFGSGIPETLKFELQGSTDNELLKFAFQHNSSRHPINIIDDKSDDYISRGLFDALSIVRRYNGLIIVRSNYGKILYDFGSTNDIEKAYKTFGDSKIFFPGTLISLYIPAIENVNSLNESSIKPETVFNYINPKNKIYVNLNEVLKDVSTRKENLYSQSLKNIRNSILFNDDEPTIVYLSFLGCKIEDRLSRKILIYLMTDYEINIKTNVVLMHGPNEEVIDSVSNTINSLSSAYKKYKIHPLPIINFKKSLDDFNIKWLGIYDDYDVEKLDDLLFAEYSLAKSDFNEPSYIEGHITSFDAYGNLTSHFPDRDTLIELFKKEEDNILRSNFRDLLEKNKGIVKDNGKDLYLCNGNYYQKEFIEINNLINSKNELENISRLFYAKLQKNIKEIESACFISITSTSNKILQSFFDLGLITNKQQLSFANYNSFELELNKVVINSKTNYVLIGDVISTGFLTERLANKLIEVGAKLTNVGVLVSVIDNDFRTDENYLETIADNIISLLDYKIKKFETNEIKEELITKNIIRINPYTNIPIRLSFEETNYNDSIIFHSTIEYDENSNNITFKNKFLDSVDDINLKVGYYKFNNVIHPYFFDTKPILDNLEIDILKKIFTKINNPKLKSDKVLLFYPRDSGIKSNSFFTNLKTGIGNDKIEEIEMDRINTVEGWRFPHNSNHLASKVDGNLCLIIDDGSSSGDSLLQMIDEISFYNANEIVLLCFIGRINDHKREFFSRISSIKVKNGNPIELSIYFATHWHIPTYYLDSNPIINETNWLKELINISNTPNSIKKIARRILDEIEPKNKNFKDYKYLPKIKGTETIPKREIIKRREEIGKVIGYRLYKESFNYFNAFVKKYSQNKKEVDRYKEIELICACFVYEPYLYDKLVKIVPDVIFLIEEFVRFLIYSYDKYEKHKSYDWDKKDVVHLFFIVFKDEKLLDELSKNGFNNLIKFTVPSEPCLDYVLYKLLRYFSILDNQPSSNNIRSFILNQLIFQSQQIDLKSAERNKIDVFNHFIATLSSNNSLEDLLNKIISEYSKIDPDSLDYHNENLKADKQIIKELLTNIGGKSYRKIDFSEDKQSIVKYSERLNTFLENILSLSSEYPDFFIDKNLLKDINSKKSNSLRVLHKEYNDIILSTNKDYKIDKCKSVLDSIYAIFINEKSNLFDLFKQIHTENILQLLLNTIDCKYIVVGNITSCEIDYSVYIPKYFTQMIFKEIDANLRHSVGEIDIKIILKDVYFSIEILTTTNNGQKGRNNGSILFDNLNKSPFEINYFKKELKENNQFLQTFKCKQL